MVNDVLLTMAIVYLDLNAFMELLSRQSAQRHQMILETNVVLLQWSVLRVH